MARQYAIGGPLGAGFVADAEDRDFSLREAYVAVPPAATGAVTVNATGQSVTATVGSVSVLAVQNVSTAVTGHAAASAVGMVTVSTPAGAIDVTVPASGVVATAALGTVAVTTTQTVSITPTGQAATAAVGSASVAVGGGVSVPATGAAMAALAGAVAVTAKQYVTAAPAGVTAAAVAGAASISIHTSITPAGVGSATAAGTAAVTAKQAVTVTAGGAQAASALGGVSVAAGGSVSVAVAGQALTASVGTVAVTIPSAGLPPVFRSVSSVAYANRGSPITVSKPAGTVNADIMLAAGAMLRATVNTGDVLSAPAGWTSVAAYTTHTDGPGQTATFEVWWKRASSEPASYDWTQNTGGNRSTTIAIAAYSGCIASGSPVEVSFSTNKGTGTTATALGITTTVANTLLAALGHNWDIAGAGPIAGGTERFDNLITISDAPQTAIGATGNKTYTSGSASGNPWQSWMVALKPAPLPAGAVIVSVAGQALTASVGTVSVTITAAPDVTVPVTGQALMARVGTVTVAITAAPDTVGVWTGSAWVQKPARVWTGSAWVTKSVKHWNGSAWIGGAPPGPGLAEPPPDAGVLPGVTRTPYTTPLAITVDGTTIANKDIILTGANLIEVLADNVTFSNCLITTQASWGIDADSRTGLVVDHCTIDGGGFGGNSCVLTGDNWTLTNCRLTGFDNGIMVQGGSGLAEGNYIYDLGGSAEAHVDGIQIAGPAGPGVVIRSNWIEGWDTACIFIKTDGGNMSGITITGNTLCNKPGELTAYCIYTEETGVSTITGTTITDNRLEEGVGGYLSNVGVTDTVWSGNIDYVTGLPATP